MLLSTCGLVCNECEFYNKTCEGCINIKGSTFWAKEMMPGKVCPLYDCAVNNKGFASCGDCSELPCKMFLDMKDPALSEEDHKKSIEIRTGRLRAN
jgi:hypothetical protein